MRTRQQGGVKRHFNATTGTDDEYRVVVEFFLTAEERDLWGAGVIKPGVVQGWEQPVVKGGQAHFLYRNTRDGGPGLGLWCACREQFGEDVVAAARHMLELQDS